MTKMKKTKPAKENKVFFLKIVAPALAELKTSAENWVSSPIPESGEDPLDLTPEQEAEIYAKILAQRALPQK